MDLHYFDGDTDQNACGSESQTYRLRTIENTVENILAAFYFKSVMYKRMIKSTVSRVQISSVQCSNII
jgi:hypothetical protein